MAPGLQCSGTLMWLQAILPIGLTFAQPTSSILSQFEENKVLFRVSLDSVPQLLED